MNMPVQAQRARDRATELFNQVNGITGESDAPEAQPTPENPAPEVDTQNPKPEVQSPAPAATPAPTPEPAPQENWEHKYRSLQGVFASERGRLDGENRTLAQRNQALEAEIAQLKAASTAAPAPTPTPASDDDTTTYGPELMQAIERRALKIADAAIERRMAALQPQLEQTRADVTNVKQAVYQTKEDRFYGELTEAVPDWRAINADPRWLEWLDQQDEVFGVPRQQALNHHQQNMDHAKVATMFSKFKEAAGLNTPAPAAAAPAPARQALSPSPRTVGNASAPTLREPQTGVKRTEIAAHYRRGSADATYRGSQEHAEMEQRIATAMATGQILEA